MKWLADNKPYDYAEWHLWFAWKPVRIKNHKYWLCLLNRRVKFVYLTSLKDQKTVIRSGKNFTWEYEVPIYY